MRRTEQHAIRSAILSFVLPGLGHLGTGRTRIALLWAAPVGVLVLAFTLGVTLGAVRVQVLLDQNVLAALLLLNGLVFVWRAAAVIHGYAIHVPWAAPRAAALVPVALVVLVALTQAVPSLYVARLSGTLERISDQGGSEDDRFLGPAPSSMPQIDGEGAVGTERSGPSPTASAVPTPTPTVPAATSSPTPGPTPERTEPPSPAATDEPARLSERVTALLLGTDNLAGRSHRLTDTMLVVSLGAEHRRPMMVSVPRDIYGAPLPDGRVYNAKLNSLAAYARARPDEFPLGGVGTLRETIELLLGIEIDHVASIDMLGLIDVVDTLGGVELTVREEIDDPHYRPATGGGRGFHLDAGVHHVDGQTALAYARSRLGPRGDDFVRAGRQQRLLGAIRERVRELGLVSTLPSLLDVIDDNVRTDIPRDRLGHFAEAVVDARWDAIERLVLAPPQFVTPGFTDRGAYVLHPDRAEIRGAVAEMLEP